MTLGCLLKQLLKARKHGDFLEVIRFGSISASVFENEIDTEGGAKSPLSVNLQRRYRDSSGQWKSNVTNERRQTVWRLKSN